MTTIDERKLDRLQSTARLVAIGVLVVLVGLIAFSGYRLLQIDREIEAKTEKLEEQTKLLEEQEAHLGKLRGLEEQLNEQIGELERRKQDLQKVVSGMASRDLYKAIQENPETTDTLQSIYPHIRDEDQKERARQVLGRLGESGFLVLQIEQVEGPDRTQVRYFHPGNPVEEEDVSKILGILDEAGVEAEPWNPGNPVANVPPRQYEIWFGKDFQP